MSQLKPTSAGATPTEFTLARLAEILSGELKGDPKIVIKDFSSLKDAKSDEISMLYSDAYLTEVAASKAAAFVTSSKYAMHVKNAIVVDNPRLMFCKVIEAFHPYPVAKPVKSELAIIDKTAEVHPNSEINPNVVIKANAKVAAGVILHEGAYIGENSIVGAKSVLMPNVVVYHDCVVGENVLLHANVTIGSDGWGYVLADDKIHKIPHTKKVVIEDDVEIGANTVIERGSMTNTVIGAGSKISSLVHVAHNVKLGKNNLVAAAAVFGGSITTGKNVVIMGNSNVKDSLTLADNSILGPASSMTKNNKSGELLYGYPARPKSEWLKSKANIRLIPKIIQRLAKLEKIITKS